MRTAVLVLPRVLNSSLAITLDSFAVANQILATLRRPARFDVQLVGLRPGLVETGTGLRLQVQTTIRSRQAFPLVVVPGVNVPEPDRLSAYLASDDIGTATAWLARQHDRGASIAGSCTATFVMARAGLLRAKPATTSWWLASLLRRMHPEVEVQPGAMVTVAGRVMTAGAALSQADLCLVLIAKYCGPQVADLVARFLVIDRRATQSRYMIATHLARRSPEVVRAEAWIRSHLDQPFSIPQLARAAGLSARTLARRVEQATGLSPMGLVTRVRAEVAEHLLQTTPLSLEVIAARVGYADASTLRRVLKRETGQTPVAHRAARAGLRTGAPPPPLTSA